MNENVSSTPLTEKAYGRLWTIRARLDELMAPEARSPRDYAETVVQIVNMAVSLIPAVAFDLIETPRWIDKVVAELEHQAKSESTATSPRPPTH